MELDTAKWSGEGEFTHCLVGALKELPDIVFVRVEDAPATRADSGYNFIANEVFVGFAVRTHVEARRRFGLLPVKRVTEEPVMTMAELAEALGRHPQIGPSDYADEGMIQYLRAERVVPPYQTRGYKLVELVRIYRIGEPVENSRQTRSFAPGSDPPRR